MSFVMSSFLNVHRILTKYNRHASISKKAIKRTAVAVNSISILINCNL